MNTIVKEKNLKTKGAALTALASSALLLVGAGCGASDATNTPATNEPAAAAPHQYKDGTYSAVGHYVSPAGPETINVTITLKDSVVTDANVVSNATNKKSIFMQSAFISGYKPLVVGKNIDEVNLSGNISGSSLTLKGFNEAITQVKAEASA